MAGSLEGESRSHDIIKIPQSSPGSHYIKDWPGDQWWCWWWSVQSLGVRCERAGQVSWAGETGGGCAVTGGCPLSSHSLGSGRVVAGQPGVCQTQLPSQSAAVSCMQSPHCCSPAHTPHQTPHCQDQCPPSVSPVSMSSGENQDNYRIETWNWRDEREMSTPGLAEGAWSEERERGEP